MENKLFHFDTPRSFQLLVGTQIRVCVAASKLYYILVDSIWTMTSHLILSTSLFQQHRILRLITSCVYGTFSTSNVFLSFESRYQFEFSFLIVCLLSIPLTLKVRLGVDSISIFCQFRKCVPDGITSWLFCAKLMPG